MLVCQPCHGLLSAEALAVWLGLREDAELLTKAEDLICEVEARNLGSWQITLGSRLICLGSC